MNRGIRTATHSAAPYAATWIGTGCVALFLFALAAPAMAGDGWSMSSLNPFKKASTSKRARGSFSDEDKGSSWLSSSRPSTRSSAAKKKGPSTFDKMSQGTKSFFTKTKDALTPWSKSSSKKPSTSKSASKKSFLSSWWPAKKEQPKPKTVGDFLAQDRPS